jgi:16S rRNA (uracil1498-N3)-methyltransferase
LEIALEKCTEVGATQFVFFAADKSEKAQITPTQKVRLETIIRSAVKQSGRVYLPSFTLFLSLQEAVSSLKDHILYFGALDEASPDCYSISSTQDTKSPKGIIIGPEAGFSQKELCFLQEHALPLTLHENILRAETAAIVGCYKLYTMQMGHKMTDKR